MNPSSCREFRRSVKNAVEYTKRWDNCGSPKFENGWKIMADFVLVFLSGSRQVVFPMYFKIKNVVLNGLKTVRGEGGYVCML